MPPIDRIPFAQHVRALRLRRGLTQREVAERAGITAAQVSIAETARDPAQLWNTIIIALAEVYEVDPDELFALADRVPTDIIDALRGNLANIKRVRHALAPC